jgi:predicted flap endonuclease-1-like 5' DNA nuclease
MVAKAKRKIRTRSTDSGKPSLPPPRRGASVPRNDEISGLFDEIADLLEIEGANPFRIRAYRQAARTLRGLERQAADLIAEGKDLTELSGIGADLAGKIAEVVATGHVAMLDRLHGELPAGLVELLRVPGIGPKRAKLLHDKLGIASMAGLQRAAAAGKLQGRSRNWPVHRRRQLSPPARNGRRSGYSGDGEEFPARDRPFRRL